MEPSEIWGLILKADEKLKYATDAKAEQRTDQARALLATALHEATAVGNEQLAVQAQRRLDDLGPAADA